MTGFRVVVLQDGGDICRGIDGPTEANGTVVGILVESGSTDVWQMGALHVVAMPTLLRACESG